MHAAVKLGESEETAAEELSESRFGGYREGKEDPEEGDAAAYGDGGEFAGAEEVDWVVRLAVGGCEIEAEFADLVC